MPQNKDAFTRLLRHFRSFVGPFRGDSLELVDTRLGFGYSIEALSLLATPSTCLFLNSHLTYFMRLAALYALVSLFSIPLFAADSAIRLEVDARDVSRSLLHSRMEIPASPGPLVVWYPKWIPGVHAPAGPAENFAGLKFETPAGDSIPWKRDDEELNRFHLTVPPNTDRVIARLDYISNQPSVNSSGVDSFGNTHLAALNWNTLLLYPEGADIDVQKASLSLILPKGWKFGTALKPETQNGENISFAPATLRRLVDCPLICGSHLRTIELTGKNTPPAFLHLVSETPAAIQLDDALIQQSRQLIAEALALFGGARWDDYHFLVVCSDQLPSNGLEHLSSSFNVVSERGLIDEKKRKGFPSYLLPHEFVHSWCGKFRRPQAMLTHNFHTPERTRLLWVYEGLTQYLGEVLAVRSGLMPLDDHLRAFTHKLDVLMHQEGRQWRALDDTAAASWQLRGRSPSWNQLRRGQDYYDEGLLVWLEADTLIRTKTDGRKSLDDFCRKFFATSGQPPEVLGYELKEIVSILHELADEDWEKFFTDRITQPRAKLPMEWLDSLGYRLQFSPKPSAYLSDREKDAKMVSLMDSLGLTVGEDGKILSVVPQSPADSAKLSNGWNISGVNMHKFSSQRLKDAVADSVTRGKVDLLILEGEDFRNISIPYGEGAKYLELVRTKDGPDRLGAILKPAIKEGHGK